MNSLKLGECQLPRAERAGNRTQENALFYGRFIRPTTVAFARGAGGVGVFCSV
jgi:hypothetical protein